MRRLIFLFLTTSLVALVQLPANAVETVGGGIAGGGEAADITGRYVSNGPAVGNGTSVQIGTGPPICYATYKDYAGNLRSIQADCGNIPSAIDFAPLAPLDPVQDTAAQAQSIVRDYLRTLSMPVPAPRMSATEGITGAVHSIDLQTSSSASFADEATSFGRLRATAYGRFTVDWGDGTQASYSSGGAPWPNKDISHSYTDAGSYDIVITARWNLDWSLGAYSGVITGLQTQASIADWNVLEAQAVLTR